MISLFQLFQMTKLAEWVFGLGLFVSTWYLIFTRKIESSFSDRLGLQFKHYLQTNNFVSIRLKISCIFSHLIFRPVRSTKYALTLYLCASEPNKSEILLAPIVLVAIIGVVLLSILIRRISTFNDCPEAAAELRKQIEQAREDLTSKGFKFD